MRKPNFFNQADKPQEPVEPYSMVTEIIRNELYPEYFFPTDLFPNLVNNLLEVFNEEFKNNPETAEMFNTNPAHESILDCAREILHLEILLKKKPRVIFAIYRTFFAKFITRKHPRQSECAMMNEKIWQALTDEHINKILEKITFDIKKISAFNAFLLLHIHQLYLEILQSEKHHAKPLTPDETGSNQPQLEKKEAGIDTPPPITPDTTYNNSETLENKEEQALLQHEFNRLQILLFLYYKQRPKLELCLKLQYRLPVFRDDVLRCFPKATPDDIEKLSADFTKISYNRLIETVSGILNRLEGRKEKSSELKKWLDAQTAELIDILNQSHGYRVYTRAILGNVVARYFAGLHKEKAPGPGPATPPTIEEPVILEPDEQ